MPDPSITALRRTVELLAVIPDPAAQSHAAALNRFLAEGPFGLTLEQALGFARGPGQTTCWEAEAIEQRNAALRAIRERQCAHLSITKAAREIASKGRRYETRSSRSASDPLYDAVVQSGGFPRWRRIYDILCS